MDSTTFQQINKIEILHLTTNMLDLYKKSAILRQKSANLAGLFTTSIDTISTTFVLLFYISLFIL